MQRTVEESTNRVIFLDNLRYFFVLCVVLQHSANAYYGHLPILKWWPVLDGSSSTILGILQVTLNGFTMPLLFFVAGYFALPTIRKYGTSSFIGGKLKRLGIPWVVCILTICPVLPLFYHYTRNGLTLTGNYLDLWVTLIKSFLRFDVGVIPSMNQLMMNNGFYQRYMWFISLLLLFLVAFSLVYRAKKAWFEIDYPVIRKNPSVSSSLKLLGTVGSLCFVGSMIAGGILLSSGYKDPTSWFTLANIVQFQACSLPVFLIYFGMGVVVNRNGWIEQGKFPGHLNTWLISTGLLLIIYLFVLQTFLTAPIGSKTMGRYGVLYLLTGSFLTMSFLGFFSSLAIRYWNRPTKIDKNLVSNSYNMYLSHYIFVLVFQLILFTIPGIPILLKFAIVSASSILCAYLVSQFLIKPFPKLTIILLSIMLVMMFVVIKP
jgi:glucan biosynthesis protein C